MTADRIAELQEACNYNPDIEGSVDDLIAYKDALEDAYAADAAALDKLAEILRRPTWPGGADFLCWANGIVRATGRNREEVTSEQIV